MAQLRDTHRIAVDGGGTRCRIALCASGPPLIVETGPVNVSTDFNAAMSELRRGLAEIASRANCPVAALFPVPAYIGLAGMTGTAIAARLISALPFEHLRVEDDRPAALRGALGDRDGIVLHCGTGSFIAQQLEGQMHLVGGWGPVLGDEASAHWVGRRALTRTLDTVDGLVAESALTRSMLHRFGGTSEIVAFAGTASPAELGGLAIDVTRAAEQGDPNARHLLQESADHLAAICRRLGWAPGMTLCLTGGIAPYYGSFLPAEMRAALVPALGEPLSGALSLAEDFRKELAHACG